MKTKLLPCNKRGMTGKQIVDALHFKYHQPVYNYFRKMKWEITGKKTKKKYHVDDTFFKVIISSKEKVLSFLHYLYYNSSIFLSRKYLTYRKACAHVKLS